MTFLAPWFLLGLAALALPVIFHLIRRRPQKPVPFSTLMFLRPAAPVTTEKHKLEDLLLLLKRLLVLVLLALAFARPFFVQETARPAAGPIRSQTVILVDQSASMRREGLWESAQGELRRELGEVRSGDEAAVAMFSRDVEFLGTLPEWGASEPGQRRQELLEMARGKEPLWTGTYLGRALMAAADHLREHSDTLGDGIKRRIVVISDLQNGSRPEEVQGYNWSEGTEVIWRPVRPAREGNAGVQALSASIRAADGVQSVAKVRVRNAEGSGGDQFTLQWDPAGTNPPVSAHVPPGQSRTVDVPRGGLIEDGRIELLGDREAFDNQVYVVQPPLRQVTLYYFGDESADDAREPLFFLVRALTNSILPRIQVSPVAGGSVPGPVANAEGMWVVVGKELTQEQLRWLQEFEARKGSALWMLRSASQARGLLEYLGRGADGVQEIRTAGFAILGRVAFEHPLFAPFSEARFSDFTDIHFWKYRKLPVAAGDATLAQFDTADPMLVEIGGRAGRILAMTTSWGITDSQLARSTKFVPLMFAMIELDDAGRADRTMASFTIGDVVPIPADLRAGRVTNPEGKQEPIEESGMYRGTRVPGIYRVAGASKPWVFAVNVDPMEARTEALAADQLAGFGIPGEGSVVAGMSKASARRTVRSHSELESRQKLWRSILAGVIAFLVIETWFAGWLTRRRRLRVSEEGAAASG